jgi:hypothetical protein
VLCENAIRLPAKLPPKREAYIRLGEGQPKGALEAAVLRARVYLARRAFAPAREVLQATIVEHPQALWPRVILSHVLLQEGRDWEAAERALPEVLALDPRHAEAGRNLAVLRRKRGRATGAA